MNPIVKRPVLPGAALFWSVSLLASSLLSLQVSAADPSQQMPEEVVITGQQQLIQLQNQIYDAEDKMYALFNEINDDDKYDINCHWQVRVNSKIKIRECRPGFFDDSSEGVAESFHDQLSGFGPTTNAQPLAASVNFHYPILKEKLKAALEEHPEFLDAILEHHYLREELEIRKDMQPGE